MIFSISKLLGRCTTSKVFNRMMLSTRIKVNEGIVCGCEETLPDGNSFLRFSGIPYAKPPINELRFQSPQRLLKFHREELDCTNEGDACFHKSTLSRQYVGSEDCLHLNVYVPMREQSDSYTGKIPVMVYIHGGGFKYDSGSRQLYSPEYLLMENVIVVTINYRQHALGFMYLPSMGISGNAGLKDQQMALQWVHENISNFNGDPDKICLFGESGGAMSAHFQVMNAKSRKFINNAICQSGSVINDWGFYGQNNDTVRSLAKLLGCKSDSLDEAYKVLMKVPVKELYDNCDNVLTWEDTKGGIRNKWRMVVEEESDDAFITQSSIDSIVSQAGHIGFPMIFGSNNGDGMPAVASAISRKKLGLINENFNFMIPRSIRIGSAEEEAVLAQHIRNFYLKGQDLSEQNIDGFLKLRTDVDYLIAQTISNDLNARYNPKCKQFLYEFQFDGKLNLQKKQMKLAHMPVAGHADDVFYLFGGVLADQVEIDEDSREWKMRKVMCKMWSNFAKYGDPTPDHDNPLPFKWSPVQQVARTAKELDFDYLVINDDMRMVRNLNKDRMDFWRNIYRRWNKEYLKVKL